MKRLEGMKRDGWLEWRTNAVIGAYPVASAIWTTVVDLVERGRQFMRYGFAGVGVGVTVSVKS